jgi:hypothetical protein
VTARIASLAVIAGTLAVLLPTAAHATDVSVSGGVLVIEGGDAANELVVEPAGVGYLVDDPGEGVVAGLGCVQISSRSASCAGPVFRLDVRSGEGRDLVGLWGVRTPATVDAGPGDDLVEGGTAADSLTGGGGHDTLNGRRGTDNLLGEGGDDWLAGSRGRDALDAAGGDDVLRAGTSRHDVLLGGDGRDLLVAGRGEGFLASGAGDDLLIGFGGGDEFEPGAGQNAILGVSERADDLDCGSGDAARDRGGGRVPGCDRVAPGTHEPEAWPPAGGDATAAALPPGNPDVRVAPVKRGDAARFTIWVDANRVTEITLCVHAFTRAEQRIRRFTKRNVRTKNPKTYQDSDLPRRTYWAIGFKGPCG